MTRHLAHGAHSVAGRYTVLASASLLCTLGLAAAPGLAQAQVTPSPAPAATSTATALTPVATAASQPSGSTPAPSATDSATPVAATPATPAAAPTAAIAAPVASAAPSATPIATAAPISPRAKLTILAGGPYTSPHGPWGTMTTDSCAVCHRVHTGDSNALLKTASPQSALCFSCHDGTGASSNVSADFGTANTTNVASMTDPLIGTGTISKYYRHDATVATSHTLGVYDEFGGVLNRHTECSDCHNPHQSQGVNATVPAANTAWPLSGRLSGTSGVAVVNAGTAAAPTQTYTYLDGSTSTASFEYQVCFKCHSGWTTQKSNTGVSPMAWALDAGLEFNPVNTSFHPVEAQGKNQSQKMVDSLNGASPYKVTAWVFTKAGTPNTVPGTVRCTQCHSSSMDFSTATPATSKLNTHVSANRGLLLQNYRDRLLKPSNEAYSDADFALCYMCHTNTPFRTETSTATNFSRHGLHMSNISGPGTAGTNIDKAGAGNGNALCSECHYRSHSTATGSKFDHLVSFAPNVAPIGTTPMWVANGTGGTCTLTCHGKPHEGLGY